MEAFTIVSVFLHQQYMTYGSLAVILVVIFLSSFPGPGNRHLARLFWCQQVVEVTNLSKVLINILWLHSNLESLQVIFTSKF